VVTTLIFGEIFPAGRDEFVEDLLTLEEPERVDSLRADDLEELVLSTADGLELARAFEGMDEKGRAKLSAGAQTLHRLISEGKATSAASEQLKSFLAKP
jgi:hypothetical protein